MGAQDVLAWSIEEFLQKGVKIEDVLYHERSGDAATNEISLPNFIRSRGLKSLKMDGRHLEISWQRLKAKPPELLLSVYGRFVVPDDVLQSVRHAINIHPSLLPKYRGRNPMFWALLEGETRAGVTAHYMTARVDGGDIIVQKSFDIMPEDTGFTLHRKAMRHAADLVWEVYEKVFFQKGLELIPQNERESSTVQPWHEGLRKIDWKRNSAYIHNQVRVMTRPFKGALSDRPGSGVVIWKTRVLGERKSEELPGTTRQTHGGHTLEIASQDRWIAVEEFEPL